MRAGSLIFLLLLTGCGAPRDDAAEEDPAKPTIASPGGRVESSIHGLCDTVLSGDEFLQLFNGNLVFVAEHDANGKAASEAIGDLVTSMVVNGLDFAKLAEYDLSFADGDYAFGAGGYGYTFSLYFAADFGDFHSGEKIPYNVFAIGSYVKNVQVSLNPKPTYTYDEGPLFELIDGDFSFGGSVRLRTDLVAFEMKSVSDIHGQEPRTEDLIHLNVTTTRATLTEVNEQFQAGGFGLSYTGTTYASPFYAVDQALTDGSFFLKHDDSGFYWEGEYVSSVTKNAVTYFQRGFASSHDQNRTEYFCDPELSRRAGTALHDLDLKGGTFTFEDGATFSYRLEEF